MGKKKASRNSVPVYMVGLVGGRSIFDTNGDFDKEHPALVKMLDEVAKRKRQAKAKKKGSK